MPQVWRGEFMRTSTSPRGHFPRNWTSRYGQGSFAQMTRAVAFFAPVQYVSPFTPIKKIRFNENVVDPCTPFSQVPALSSTNKCPVALSCCLEEKPSGDLSWSWGGGDATLYPVLRRKGCYNPAKRPWGRRGQECSGAHLPG